MAGANRHHIPGHAWHITRKWSGQKSYWLWNKTPWSIHFFAAHFSRYIKPNGRADRATSADIPGLPGNLEDTDVRPQSDRFFRIFSGRRGDLRRRRLHNSRLGDKNERLHLPDEPERRPDNKKDPLRRDKKGPRTRSGILLRRGIIRPFLSACGKSGDKSGPAGFFGRDADRHAFRESRKDERVRKLGGGGMTDETARGH